MANTNDTGFNYRQGEKENYVIANITLEGGKRYTSDEYAIDMRHEGAYLISHHTGAGMFVPMRLVNNVGFNIKDVANFEGLSNVAREDTSAGPDSGRPSFKL